MSAGSPGGQGPSQQPAAPGAVVQPQPPIAASGQPASRRQPLLIYTASLHIAVFEARKAIDAVEDLALARGGYLVTRSDNAITVRIPADRFAEAVDEIARTGDILTQNVTAQDVTAEFRDLETRLRNLDAVRDRLAKLLDQAKTVQDAITVERELERVTTEIEAIKGRLKLLGELIAYSTITAVFQPRAVESVTSTVKLPFRWLNELGLQRLLSL
jgi:hypothetical protein